MPIKSFADNLHSKTEFSIGRDVELHFCSDTCLLRDLDDRSRVVRTGQTDATALTVILGEDRLLVPLAGARRADAHILGAQNGYERGRENWEKLVGCRHSALMPVYRVCNCMAEVQILDGEAFEDAATTPAWKKVRGIVGKAPSIGLKNQPVAFDQWRSWMGELANGLDELERMGLAHGDPYPFNAICTGSGAAWVDFGHLTNDPAQHFKDAWAFVLFTVLHTLGKSRAYSPALLKNLAAALVEAEQPGRFDRVRQTLSESYSDVVSISDARVPSLIFAEAVAEQSQKIFQSPDLSKLLLKSAVQYFSDFLHHIQRGNQYFAGFNFEKQRHHFVEQEMLRLTVPLAEYRSQIASLNQAVGERDGQIASLNQVVVVRDGQIASLNQAVGERDHQLVHLRQEAYSLFNRLEQLVQSRSWQLTRPLRAAARLIRYESPFADGSRAIYDVAARIGRRFPFPLWLKARVRAALIKRVYPNVKSTPARKGEVDRSPSLVFDHLDASRSVIRPECCGLIDGVVSVVLPVYNQANLIAESIESVLSQTYQNFELIIINDGSADGVEAVLERYLDHPKIRCFTQDNQRLPKALSNGFSFAQGEFWTWTSADNIMEPRMLEMLVAKLRADLKLGMTFADYYAIDDRGHLLQDPIWRAHNRPNPSSSEIRLPHTTEALNSVQDNFIGPCFMYRGWIGRCLGDYDPHLGVEDYDYWMRINAFFPIEHLGDDSLLYRYRVHENTLSAQAHEHRILEKAQRLMTYEKERAEFYAAPLEYVADSRGFSWLQARGIPDTGIYALEQDIGATALVVMSSASAEQNISQLLCSSQPVAVIMNRMDTRYHKLVRLFASGNCIVLAEDSESAERVRLLSSSCPVVDANSGMALTAKQAFAKNLLFVRATRSVEELKRKMPHRIIAPREQHVVVQVDSFTQGGMENVVIDLALSLKINHYLVTIVNFGKSGDAAAKAKECGLQFVSLPADMTDEAYRSWMLEQKVYLVNAHYSIRGAAVCSDAGIPFIQTIHNSYVWLDPLQIEKYREADHHTTQYICVSMTAARYADVVLGLDVGKMHVVPNGIDPRAIDATSFDTNRASLRSAWGVSAEAPVFLNVASIMATKAQLPLVKAFACVVEEIPEARLVLLGAVIEVPYQAAIEKAVQELGLQKSVLFAGYDRNVSRYYHASDVFVLPSYWEGWSLSLGEAMANGLACVITDVGSAYEFEGFDSVEIVEPPFGDIALLNYRNLGDFVYGADAAFNDRLAGSMIKMASLRRAAINIPLAEQIDREIAYRAYAEIFSDATK